jgi:hypothetical protein
VRVVDVFEYSRETSLSALKYTQKFSGTLFSPIYGGGFSSHIFWAKLVPFASKINMLIFVIICQPHP